MSQQDYNFSDIAPYDDSEFHARMENLVKEPGFLHAVNYIMPSEAVPPLIEDLLKINTKDDFQKQVMFPFLEMLAKKTTSGITLGGIKYLNPSMNYTFITNHRDIVLDASFLNLAFLRKGVPTSEVAIGNNLLIFDWINDLVRLNKSLHREAQHRIARGSCCCQETLCLYPPQHSGEEGVGVDSPA